MATAGMLGAASGPAYALIQADTIATMRRLPPGCIDLAIGDPPYFLSVERGYTNRGGKRAAVTKGTWDTPTTLTGEHEFHRQWLREVQRLLAPHGTLWVSGTHHTIFSIGWALQHDGWEILNPVTWKKPAPPPNLGCRTLTHSTEILLWARPYKGAPHVFNYAAMKAENGGKQLLDHWTIGRAGGGELAAGRHPTQKPRELFDRMIKASSVPGAIILEPFAGSGTGALAARALGRRWIGIDADPDCFDMALRNLTLPPAITLRAKAAR